jgi:hypothetical protein
MDGLARIENGLNNFNNKFEYLAKEVNEIKRVQTHLLQITPNAEATLKQEVTEAAQLEPIDYSVPSARADSQVLTSDSPYGSTPGQQRLLERPDHPIDRIEHHLESTETALDQMELPRPREEEEEEESGGDPGPPKDSSIPINHTTGAARLLLLGPIAEMCKDAMSSTKIRNEKYPIQQEIHQQTMEKVRLAMRSQMSRHHLPVKNGASWVDSLLRLRLAKSQEEESAQKGCLISAERLSTF